jgi:hypothetical protein
VFVVDSSVWIDLLAGRPGREAELLERAIRDQTKLYLCGPVLQEVLQGIRKDADYQREWRNLLGFPFLEATRWTFLRAAGLYRGMRKKGITINSFDTTIAAVCLENGLPLLTRDRRGFEPLARHAGLRLA